MRDVDYDYDGDTAYECFTCGTILMAESNPGSCPDCSGSMRNRRTPLE
ncbi:MULTISPECIES: rubrerythrin-like domain-containing protein [unclassified Haladaptatus]|nr:MULTISPECIES: rubrerythrin-like domain-containing protein [unclassified Haladaptatus]MCO8245474.1 rubrerythrin-like domain-containing protein [Haladaptatus sp. AB643]MCO8256586.1 rubrerythrin-like domain-containing protein [Haladaptatus sp. AB618]